MMINNAEIQHLQTLDAGISHLSYLGLMVLLPVQIKTSYVKHQNVIPKPKSNYCLHNH